METTVLEQQFFIYVHTHTHTHTYSGRKNKRTQILWFFRPTHFPDHLSKQFKQYSQSVTKGNTTHFLRHFKNLFYKISPGWCGSVD